MARKYVPSTGPTSRYRDLDFGLATVSSDDDDDDGKN